MCTIATSELTLAPLGVADAEAMFELLSDAELYRYLDYPPPPSVEHLRAVYAQLEARKSPDVRTRRLFADAYGADVRPVVIRTACHSPRAEARRRG
jgi:hypothetical protein